MMRNIALLCLTILYFEHACADPVVDSDSTPQGLRKNNKNYVERPLAVGDTFTAGELLPVAQKLFEKVEKPGKGKGIVSSSKSPQDLADKIFQGFFLTSKRIVTLTDLDISGLDALQSLALVGDPATTEKFSRRSEKNVVNINGQLVASGIGGKVSRYNMLHKVSGRRSSQGKDVKLKGKSRGELLKHLGKNSHLVVSQKKDLKKDKITRKNSCRWNYECVDPTDLDTCRLKANCAPRRANEKVDHSKYINDNLDIDPVILEQFRKSLCISALDEEVEKIIERKLLKLRPENDLATEIEGLSEYFHKILIAEAEGQKETTTPMSDVNVSSVEDRDEHNNVKKLDAQATDTESSNEGPNEKKPKASDRRARRA